MTVTVHFEVTLRLESSNATEVLRNALRQTAGFAGALELQVLVDDAAPQQVLASITWDSETSFEAYVAWRQTPDGATRLPEVLAGPPRVRRFSSQIPL